MAKRAREMLLTPEERQTLAKIIYDRRLKLNVSQATVARYIQRARCAVSYAENGKVRERAGYEMVLNGLSKIENERMLAQPHATAALMATA